MISVGTEFKETVDGYFNSWLPAYDIVKDAIETRKENDPEGRLIMFETSGCPWKEHLFNIEEKLGIKGEILYVIYKNKETDWRIQVKKSNLRGGPIFGPEKCFKDWALWYNFKGSSDPNYFIFEINVG